MYKRNNLITTSWLAVSAVVALLGPLAGVGRGNFVLWDDQQLTVNSSHSTGVLYDTSRAFIVTGGSVNYLYANNSSTVDITDGSVSNLYAYNSSDVNITGGSLYYLSALDYSTVDISGGYVGDLYAYNSSDVNITSGSVSYLYANNSSTVDISGGSLYYLIVYNSSDVNISGGSLDYVYAYDSSVVTLYGQNFRVGGGLAFDGERLVGTGFLIGEWMDGTGWVMNILANASTATILAIPESAHKPFCAKYPRMDFNGDCKVDFADFAIMASSWLECNLVPQSTCWE